MARRCCRGPAAAAVTRDGARRSEEAVAVDRPDYHRAPWDGVLAAISDHASNLQPNYAPWRACRRIALADYTVWMYYTRARTHRVTTRRRPPAHILLTNGRRARTGESPHLTSGWELL